LRRWSNVKIDKLILAVRDEEMWDHSEDYGHKALQALKKVKITSQVGFDDYWKVSYFKARIKALIPLWNLEFDEFDMIVDGLIDFFAKMGEIVVDLLAPYIYDQTRGNCSLFLHLCEQIIAVMLQNAWNM
jgi:hypothetical protein